MKIAPVILALALLSAGCSRHDAEFTTRIPGIWKQELKSYTNTLTVVPDGTFAFSRLTTNRETTFTNAGTWHIRNGVLVLNSTGRTGEHPLSLGEIFRAEIVSLDDHSWVFRMQTGTTNYFKR